MSTDQPSPSRSGLPATGPGSPATWGRRFAALMIDWVLANIAALILVGGEAWEVGSSMTWVPLVCWFGMVWLSTAFTGASMGQWMLGVRIVRVAGGRVGVLNAALRTALILLVIPPIVADKDRRGLHDLAANTAAVNGPHRTPK
ncbi:RDD family protein [Phytoactinopolyspora halotolerans]|uniref:RDD family protein n=1 Tax=Phytoactinopolyspora halotolerans TaxID=1981512 RepID=A0A6L9S9N7_9ACTN|nr:RDD family protein [Phytoactinopolyspora halotolerans]NEE01753.1 RDD family protein [Phytoactinopolyspora halotolerans]